jgi:type IX secretion system PorP/SprF family membrane protein
MKPFLYLFLLLTPITWLTAQDVHLSQWGMSAWSLNPASQVAMQEQTRATLQHRRQWASVPVPYLTSAITIEHQRKLTSGSDRVGLGLTMLQDQSGDGRLNWTQQALTLGYGRKLSRQWQAFLAAQPNFYSRSVNVSRLTFGDQHNGEYYDPTLPNGESIETGRSSFFSLGLGGLVRFMPQNGILGMVEAGIAQYHVNSPSYGFYEGAQADLPAHTAIHIATVQRVGPGQSYQMLMHRIQGPYRQTFMQAGYRYILDLKQPLQFDGAVAVRLGDAMVPSLTTRYGPFSVGLSYDFNFSDFKSATNNLGGPEIALRYSIWPVEPPKAIKVCPVF